MITGLTFNGESEYPCQADLVILTGNKILLYEFKAYSQPAIDRDNKLEYLSGYQFKHPKLQLNDTHQKLAVLLRQLKIPLPIESYIMFTHPNFYIYELPAWSENYIFYSHITTHIKNMMQNTTPPDEHTYTYYNRLMDRDNDTSENNPIIPKYQYHSLNKVVKCPNCHGVIDDVPDKKINMTCSHCHSKIHIRDIVKKAINDYQILFKKHPTPSELYEWCGGSINRWRIYKTYNAK